MKDKIELLYNARVPTIFWGPPGVGKTAAIEHFSEEKGLPLISPAVRTPEQFALPVQVRDGVRLQPVDEFIEACDVEEGIVFLDELSTLDEDVQAALLRFLDSGRIGGRRISPNVWRVAAANPPHQAAGGVDLAPPTANRLVHVQWAIDPQRFPADFASNWGKPVSPKEQKHRSEVAAFLAVRPELIVRVPENVEAASGPWPSPRTWEFAVRIMAEGGGPDMVGGAVGGGPASEFFHWRAENDLPYWRDVESGAAELPSRTDQLHALALQVVAEASTMDDDSWRAAWRFIAVLVDADHSDVAWLAAQIAKQRNGREYPPEIEKLAGIASLLME